MFKLAHLSDPHLPPPRRVRPAELAGKRLLALANWYGRRGREHRPEVLRLLADDLAQQACDHIAVTGDLVVASLSSEFPRARVFLESIGDAERVTFVPGNHDAYVPGAKQFWKPHWGEYMCGDAVSAASAPVSGVVGLPTFPFVRRRGPLALIGLSTALPTGPFMAWGFLEAAELTALEASLQSLAAENLFRVVLLHHAPDDRAPDPQHGLRNAAAFREIIRRVGAELVLHGHHHQRSVAFIAGPDGPVPVVGVASASAVAHNRHPATYNLYGIARAGESWSCEMVTRGLTRDGRVDELERRQLRGGPSAGQ